jgi:superfamily II DNA or RNA helicase
VRLGQDNLLSHQLEFRDHFLAEKSRARQLLLAPTGLGKGYVAQVIADQVVREESDGKALFLVPAGLREQFASALGEWAPPYSVESVDRRRLREILSGAQGDDVWPCPSIVVMSIEFARQEDVTPLLLGSRWSLLVVDEAHLVRGPRMRLIRELADIADRVLLLSAVDAEVVTSELPDLEVVRWSRDVVDAAGRRLLVAVPRARHVVDYARSQEEASLAAAFLRLIQEGIIEREAPQLDLIRRVMMNALASSRSALEQTLLRQLDKLSADFDLRLATGQPMQTQEGTSEVETETNFLELLSGSPVWKQTGDASRRLTELVARLDALPADTKAGALRTLIDTLRRREEGAPICIFTSFAATAEYLAEVLAESTDVFLLTGAMAVEARTEAAARVFATGGVLIATHAVQGMDLSTSHLAVHYDLPERELQMEQRWGRLDRVGQTETVQAFAFRDQLRTLEWEETVLRRHGFI